MLSQGEKKLGRGPNSSFLGHTSFVVVVASDCSELQPRSQKVCVSSHHGNLAFDHQYID